MRDSRFRSAVLPLFMVALITFLLVPAVHAEKRASGISSNASGGHDEKVDWRFAGWRLSNIGIFDDELSPDAAIRAATFQHLIAKGTPGPATIRGFVRPPVAEGPPGPPTSPECAGFAIESPVTEAVYSAVLENLSQVYFKLDTGFVCVDPPTGRVQAHLHGSFVGGTEKYEGATGNWDLTADVVAPVPIPDPGGFGLSQFQAQSGTMTGTIHVAGD